MKTSFSGYTNFTMIGAPEPRENGVFQRFILGRFILGRINSNIICSTHQMLHFCILITSYSRILTEIFTVQVHSSMVLATNDGFYHRSCGCFTVISTLFHFNYTYKSSKHSINCNEQSNNIPMYLCLVRLDAP